MNIVFASSEVAPFAKTGGLADVCGSLPAELHRQGHNVAVVTPAYRQVKSSGLPIEPLGVKFDIPIGNKIVRGRLLRGQLPGSDVPVFFVEQAALSNMARHLHDRRADELLKGELGDLSFRLLWISVYCSLIWLSLLLTFDALAGHLFGLPIFIGRLKVDMEYAKDIPDAVYYALSFMWNDSIVVTSMLAVALLVYPLARMAWFFCYIDVRVRRDCWDMELAMVREAERLEAA